MVVNGDALLLESPIADMMVDKVRLYGVSHGLAEVGYDIRLKQEVKFLPGVPFNPEIEIWDPEEKVTVYKAGRFCIASAMEEFDMPTNLMGIVHDKSTWARKGLSVFNTVIEPGWKGFLTLELVYHGSEDLILPAGVGIAQVVFHRLMRSAQYKGKYQDQENRPVEAVLAA